MKGNFVWNLPKFDESVSVSIDENKVRYSDLSNNKIESLHNNFLCQIGYVYFVR